MRADILRHVLTVLVSCWRPCRVRLSKQGRREQVERGEVIAGILT